MTATEQRAFKNLLIYIGIAVANMAAIALAAGVAGGSLVGFRDGDPFAVAGPSMAALLAVVTPILSTWLASNRPRIGSEAIAAAVDERRHAGQSRKSMVVRSKGSPPDADEVMTPSQLKQVSDEIERRLRADADETAPHG